MKPGCTFNDGTSPGGGPCGRPSTRFFQRAGYPRPWRSSFVSRCDVHEGGVRVSDFYKGVSYEEFVVLQVLDS